MDRLIAFFVMVVLASPAWAVCPTVVTDCTSAPIYSTVQGWEGMLGGPWTTGTRPNLITGLMGFNTTLGAYEFYNGSSWVQLSPTSSGVFSNMTVTGSFTATGLVTNADLANSGLTLGSTALTLGGTTTSVSGLTLVAPTLANGSVTPSVSYDARAFGSCTWDVTHDVGPCINAAITAATSVGGGDVVIPSGSYGLATTLSVGVTGIHLRGAGVGASKDDRTTVSVTSLVWIGAAGGTMLDIEPASNVSLYSDDVVGITFDGADLANYAVKIMQVSNSVFYFGTTNARLINTWFTTEPGAFGDGPGNQNNDAWLWSRNSSGTYSPTGILIDGGATSSWNTSFNRFHILWAWYAKGDGVVFGWGDNNLVGDLVTFPDGTTHGGTPVIWANTAYVAKNGVAVNGSSTGTRVLKTQSSGIVAGFQSGSTITAGVHVGTAAVTTVPLTTNGTTTAPNPTLNFAGTTNVLPGMTATCGTWHDGVAPNTPVLLVGGTTVSLASGTVRNVASGQSCVFSYGITTSAVTGTYTMTAVDGAHWTLTAPAGGHSQSNIAVASGAITFTDMVVPLTGTPSTNDTFTIVVPFPVTNTSLEGFDGAVESGSAGTNHIPLPMVEAGGTTYLASMLNPYPTMLGGTGDITVTPLTGTTHNTRFGGFGNIVTGAYSSVFGGINNSATGFGSRASGQTASASGLDDVAEGSAVTTTGRYSRAEGSLSTDRGRYGVVCNASGDFAAQGDAQTCQSTIRGTGTSTAAVALTADGVAANSANCINIPNNSGYALNITIMAFDHTTVTKNETWLNWSGLLTRGANAASTALTMQTKVTPLTNGSVGGSDVTATADTTNGCLSLTFTPPTANTDTWNAVARVTTVEVQ